jgi:pyruvate dehydrogenase E1 component alpha subunit
MTISARFEIELYRCLDASGSLVGEPPAFATDRDVVVDLYRFMLLTRVLDERAVELQRTGRLGTYASSLGQEAVSVGVAHAMSPDDVFLPSFREQGGQLVRGVTAEEILLYWGGDERGSNFAGPRNDFPVSIPVGGHTAHAAGAALAFKLRQEPRAAVAVVGDGGTSKGDFYEALNVAGVWALPVVFVATNNQWAISVPRPEQTAAETLAQKAIAAGITGMQVDGNDILIVRQAVLDALERARRGAGPTLIEAITYRLGDHTTVDDASRYRSEEEVAAAREREPIARLRSYLGAALGWTEDEETQLLADCRAVVDAATESYLAREPQSPDSIFQYTFASLPRALALQRDEMLQCIERE